MHFQNRKLYTLESAKDFREDLRQQGKTFVLTNGCFDLFHPGHLYYLQEAALLGDSLWIGLNSKASIQGLKGPNRPLQRDLERAYILSGLECIKGIFIFNNLRLAKEILELRPDIYVKAGDYTLDTLNEEERKALEVVGSKICFVPFLEGYSTTKLIQTINQNPL